MLRQPKNGIVTDTDPSPYSVVGVALSGPSVFFWPIRPAEPLERETTGRYGSVTSLLVLRLAQRNVGRVARTSEINAFEGMLRSGEMLIFLC